MKRYITRFLKSIAAFFLVFPILYIVLVALLFDIPLSGCVQILLSPFYYIVAFCTLAAGYGLWEMRRWSWYLFIISQILLTYGNTILILNYATSHHRALAFSFSILFQVILFFRVSREVRVPYFFPRIRWWESNPRYRLSVPVELTRKSEEKLTGEILDLSSVGCFIKLRSDLLSDEKISISYKIFDYEIHCDGVVVWSAVSSVTYPKGVGVKFVHLTKTQKRSLRFATRKLRKISTIYRRYRYLMSQEEFLKKLKEVETKYKPSFRKQAESENHL